MNDKTKHWKKLGKINRDSVEGIKKRKMTKYKNNFFTDGSKIYGDLKHCAYTIFKNDKIKVSKVIYEDLDIYQVEGLAVLECLKIIPEKGKIFCDNKQVVDELNGKKDPKDKNFYNQCKELMDEKSVKVIKIKRDENHAGRYLSKRWGRLKRSINRKNRIIPLRRMSR